MISGSKVARRMHIDFTMSKRTRQAFENLGLMGNELFAMRHPSQPEAIVSFNGHHLFNTPYVDFPSPHELEAAKAELIKNLENTRAHIENARDRPKVERIEI